MNTNDKTDGLQRLVRTMADAVYNDPAEQPIPMATENPADVIRSQLTENTGTHFLDSGFDSGRHWQQNQDNPPWGQPAWRVGDGYVTHNIYDFMSQYYSRDRLAVSLEMALYAASQAAWDTTTPRLGEMEEFAESIDTLPREEMESWGLPGEVIEDVLGFAHGTSFDGPLFTWNTYNQETHSLSQCIQGTAFGGPYADYAMVQVHQGADVRGGYTGPRVYKNAYGVWSPMELEFRCGRCDWVGYESCLYNSDELVYQHTIDPFELEEMGLLPLDGDDDHPALDAAYDADHIDGAVLHKCDDGGLGHVMFG